MHKWMSIAIAVCALGACKNKFDQALSELADLKDRMCACQDRACTDKLFGEYRAWQKSTGEKVGNDEPSQEQDEKGHKLGAALESCHDKFRPDGAGGPGPTGAAGKTP
jgi:hypothetical protein